MQSIPVVKDVVLVGAGHAHIAVLRSFGMKPVPGVRLTLITREVHTPYSGMLPGLVAGLYGVDEAHIDTGPLTRFAGARLYQDEVLGIDLDQWRVICRSRPAVPFDLLSLDIGSTPNTAETPGAREHAVPVKPIDGFLRRFESLKRRMLERRGHTRIAVVGGGAGGVELMLALERRLRREAARAGFDPASLAFTLVSSGNILPSFPAGFRERLRRIMQERKIQVFASAVSSVNPGQLILADGGQVEADEFLWVTEARPAEWLRTSGLPVDERGFVLADANLQVRGFEHVFAAGDIITHPARSLPKSGVYAVRAGPVLADNVRRSLEGKPLRAFHPQRDALYLVSTGERYAVGTRNGISFEGRWVWDWKNWIDCRFMRRFNELPPMGGPEPGQVSSVADAVALQQLSTPVMRCGGCGAKVGASVLSRALAGVEPVRRPEVVVGLEDADDAALIDLGGDKLSIETVDYFRAMIDDPYLFGKIAANHSLGDIYAMGGEPRFALAIATLPYGPEAKVESDLAAMMAGAVEVLREADCALVGGHSSEGAELALGFSVHGAVARGSALRKGGLRPGAALILTKPVGTGTLLAAHMRGKAKARWVMAAIAHMIQSQRRAAEILQARGAEAATDVTGFGLIGHLAEMVRAAAVDVTLALEQIPVLEGARETVGMQVFSSMQPENLRLRHAIRNVKAAARHPSYPLLFDPQTAGGILAAVPLERARRCVAELVEAGYAQARIVGVVSERSSLEPIAIDVEHTSFELAPAPEGRPVEPIG
jgi:selenide, water dikinase